MRSTHFLFAVPAVFALGCSSATEPSRDESPVGTTQHALINDPTDIGVPALWLKGDQGVSLGTNGQVYSWTDQSHGIVLGVGNPTGGSIAVARFGRSGPNAVSFNGQAYMVNGAFTAPASMTIAIVFRPNLTGSPAPSPEPFVLTGLNGGSPTIAGRCTTGCTVAAQAGSPPLFSFLQASAYATQARYVVATYDGTASRLVVRDGSGDHLALGTLNPNSLGGISLSTASSRAFKGLIGEVIVYPWALPSTLAEQDLLDYLETRYPMY